MRRSPLRELTKSNPATVRMNVHDFEHQNPDLINAGKTYLQANSELAYHVERDKSKINYITNYFIPALKDLALRIDRGDWDYKGSIEQIPTDQFSTQEDKEKELQRLIEKRNKEKRELKIYFETLSLSYQASPEDKAAEEIVMFCDILKQREQKKTQEGDQESSIKLINKLKYHQNKIKYTSLYSLQ